jgi:hypothetical protein
LIEVDHSQLSLHERTGEAIEMRTALTGATMEEHDGRRRHDGGAGDPIELTCTVEDDLMWTKSHPGRQLVLGD